MLMYFLSIRIDCKTISICSQSTCNSQADYMFFVISHIRLEEGRVKAQKDGVLLACHELNRKFLVPLLLESVHKYQLFDQFQATVKGNMNHL